ncbi:MAG: rhomboid family intramembrane serine protease [Sandaracinaceae bacterium]|nr:rhomboid family intramembrane serine protease [Sandaracinaceae bacterium]
MLDKLERRLGRYALPHLTLLLVAGQAGAFVLGKAKPEFLGKLVLVTDRVLAGEVWRLVTWVFLPRTDSIFFIIFELWLLFIFGRALEASWGNFRFNVFFLIGFLLTTAVSFAVPWAPISNAFLMASIFLAFAYLNPDFELLLFFILPVKIKWFAYLTWAAFAVFLVIGSWQDRAVIGAGVVNFFLFFGPDMWLRVRGAGRRTVKRQEARVAASKATHRCEVCGVTDLDDPKMQFRYCTTCAGKRGYCTAHIKEHEHVRG